MSQHDLTHDVPSHPLIELDRRVCAQNYAPLPVVANRAEGSWIWDTEGRRYLDMMSAYSAVSFGHAHPRLVAALVDQAQRLSVTSRAIHSDQLAPFLDELVHLTGLDMALPMNSGAEAVETAIKVVRKWGHVVKGIPDGAAEIIVFDNNFHGRTTTLISFSSHTQYRAGFAPLTGGFRSVRFGDIEAFRRALTPHTCAVLIEPIQGEGGVIVPPPGYLSEIRRLCDAQQVMLIADEIQTGMGRTGQVLAIQHEQVKPDGVCLGKALGGGLLPVSAFVATEALLGVIEPGDHGSTFGGNALAARVAREALAVLIDEQMAEQAVRGGKVLRAVLDAAQHRAIAAVRGRGLMLGVQLVDTIDAHRVVERLAQAGVVTKDTYGNTIRLSPPLNTDSADLEWGALRLLDVLDECVDTVTPKPKAQPAEMAETV
jgi:ornithine--oxo-acid transaminase